MIAKYSFLVPVYNVEQYLERCIDTILKQSYAKDDYEIILVDDGSTDRSSLICDEYASKYSSIFVIHQENRGLLQARKTAVENARGKYFFFIDSDDYVDKDFLTIVDTYIELLNPDVLMYGQVRVENGVEKPVYLSKCEYTVLSKEEMLELIARSDTYNAMNGKVVRAELLKDHLEEIYSYRINIGEDKIQTAYLAKYSVKTVIIQACPYYYMIRSNSLMHKKTIEDIYEAITMYGIVRNVVEETVEQIEPDRKESLLELYDAAALQSVMDHIFKYDIRMDVTGVDKVNALHQLMKDENVFFQVKNKKMIKLYNRPRCWMLNQSHYKALLRTDYFLYKIKSVVH